MTGPEHYRRAEEIIDQIDGIAEIGAQEGPDGPLSAAEHDVLRGMAAMLAQIAQVHATLALTAATAQNIRRNGAVADVAADTWNQVLS